MGVLWRRRHQPHSHHPSHSAFTEGDLIDGGRAGLETPREGWSRQAEQKPRKSGGVTTRIPQGLKPTLILLHLRHD